MTSEEDNSLSADSDNEEKLPPQSAPDSIPISVQCFDDAERAEQFGHLVGTATRELSRHIDLSTLDGITVAANYEQALLDLDRGYKTTHELTPSEEHAIGVAMTPAVVRDGKIKSHIVLNASYATHLENVEHEDFNQALHLLAHECAHVEVTQRFNTAFPGTLLQRAPQDAHDAIRWQIILACWDEYAVTWISAPFGRDPTDGYEEVFIGALDKIKAQANELIKAYRLHRDINKVLFEVYGAYGDLMKFAAYHLGNLRGRGLVWQERTQTTNALKGHWFALYFERLDEALQTIAKNYGEWEDQKCFEALGDLADELAVHGGVRVTHLSNGELYIDIPFSAETMPT